ncbi:putative peptidoglycan biosynthesis protein MviN [Corynebacterium occultum]|uniref:Putative peptidoglycan biosynthesis protein MviN n=1 Tax=Corynebacterium occultum TaxID=2675219 RepID=A0A6B8WFF1_9CORY|nr:murein biosynthesis integral membrane protein MurJ [Corynebacterium occultum]QGU08700.1 putative peptidoglycan biosynthesis protein MviN [Corynebacterium occultum]
MKGSAPTAGLRGRIVPPTPPAPVPEPRPVSRPRQTPPVEDRSRLTRAPGVPQPAPETAAAAGGVALAEPAEQEVTSNEDVVRSTGSMAIATLISRITGFLRNAMIGASLGPAVASAFNTANTLPNLITEIVLGAVLTSLVVPVLVRAENEDADRGAAFIRRLFTLSMTLLIIVTAVALLTAPLLTRMMLGTDGQVNVIQSTSFAFLLLPQILFYGIFSLFMAVLNTKGIFKPGAWAPVANNLVSIAVLSLYLLLPGGLNPAAPSGITDPHVLLLGLGTTLGVVVQALIMLVPLRRAGIDLRPLWGIDDRLKQFGGMALAILVYVGISQAGYIVTTNIAAGADAAAPIIYSQAWLLLQVPYGIIGVTLLTAIMPRLSRNAAAGDDKAVVGDLTMATKLTFIALIPVVVFFTAFGPDIAVALFHYGNFDLESSSLLGLTLSFSAFTLIPYALVLLHLRVFYAREEAWTPTFIIAGITATKIVLSLASPLVAASPSRVVVLLGAANGFGFVAGAFIGAFLLRRKLGSLGFRDIMRTTAWATAASIIGVGVALVVHFLLDLVFPELPSPMGSILAAVKVGIAGIIFLVVTGVTLSFSRLPEVQNLGVVLQRVPGLRRFIRPDTSRQIEVEEPTVQEISTQLQSMDTFNASPVPPPMSAGVVRGPRLVPGAPVSDGRFRLLADHGSVPGARFWQARERSSGRTVGLVFVDTTGSAPMAPATPAAAAGAAAEVVRRTRKLGRLEHPAISGILEVDAYRAGCLVVTEWVQGTSLKAVAEQGADPRAAAYAISGLADAAADARDSATPLGLDNHARIRINTDGEAVLAFPAVLTDASYAADLASIGAAFNVLIEDESAPAEIRELRDEIRQSAALAKRREKGEEEAGEELIPLTPAECSRRLRHLGLGSGAEDSGEGEGPDTGTTPIVVTREPAPQPKDRPGFGSRSYSRRMLATIAVLVILLVTIGAALIAFIASFIGGDSEQSPISPESIQGSQTSTAPRVMPVIQPLNDARGWPGSLPGNLARIIDRDEGTTWRYAGNFEDVGIALELENLAGIQQLSIRMSEGGAQLSVHALPAGTDAGAVTSLTETREIAADTLSEGLNTLVVESTTEVASDRLILWFDQLPAGQDELGIAEVEVIGQTLE